MDMDIDISNKDITDLLALLIIPYLRKIAKKSSEIKRLLGKAQI